jgi:hypothetical protein
MVLRFMSYRPKSRIWMSARSTLKYVTFGTPDMGSAVASGRRTPSRTRDFAPSIRYSHFCSDGRARSRCGRFLPAFLGEQSKHSKACKTIAADDQMIMNGHVERLGESGDLRREMNVRVRRFRIAGRMIRTLAPDRYTIAISQHQYFCTRLYDRIPFVNYAEFNQLTHVLLHV